MSFEYTMVEKTKMVETYLQQHFPITFPNEIYEAMNYSLLAGGKRLRPLLLLGACEGAGGKDALEKALPFACAVECIHTYSLIHDDLPAMDDDDIRRGRPSNHKQFGEALAILAGDALLNKAFELMSEACLAENTVNKVRAMAAVAKASGASGMIGGQTVDILSENKTVEKDTLLYIHDHKTSALIQASLVAGGWLGGYNGEEIEQLYKAGQFFGRAFQIRDDILDVTATSGQLGKPVGSDQKNRKQTYVAMFGLEKAKEDYAYYSGQSMEIVNSLPLKSAFLQELMAYMTKREH